FYVGDEPTTIGNTQHAASIIVGVSSSGRQAPRGPLPNGTAHVSGTHIVGTVENVASRTLLTAGTTIFAVYYDRTGKVIGGTRLGHLRFATGAKIAPHKTSSFTAGSGAAVAPARIASVKISVVPTFANVG
ncbi:MAG TPA: hypothetical protein VKT18_02800, partial [Acidimicrobiales bacterium]|nr:hypothetical protein [Acidimicrobiales bacterium]